MKNKDNRGFFSKLFCIDTLKDLLKNKNISQVNHSYTEIQGSVRGIHFQKKPYQETKLIKVLRGAVYDVAVDLKTGKYFSYTLSEDCDEMMLVPEGFGHGFQVLKPHTELLYLHTETYQPGFEDGINPLDPEINISWPLPITNVSSRDQQFSNFKQVVTRDCL